MLKLAALFVLAACCWVIRNAYANPWMNRGFWAVVVGR